MAGKRAAPVWPWDDVELEPREVSAIKAIAATNPVGFEALLKISGVDRASYTIGGDDGRRASDFAEGRRWVGLVLRKIRDLRMPGPKQAPAGPHTVPIGEPPA